MNILRDKSAGELSIDDPGTTLLRKNIIRGKPFLKKIYQEWYGLVAERLPSGSGSVLELGSGAGFMEEHIDGLITSEVFFTPLVSTILDGCDLPFPDGSLRSIVMVDVFHHIPRPRKFLAEAARSLRAGGRIIMVEPWHTVWSRFIYTRFHHEPYLPDAVEWDFPSTGPLSGANSALPWIVFQRDRKIFLQEFPQFHLAEVMIWMPFRYLLSGGLTFRSLVPGSSFSFWKKIETLLGKWNEKLGMFAVVVLDRVDV